MVEDLKELATGGGIIEVLELPVSPASQMLIADISYSVDLIDTVVILSATAELTDKEGDSVALCILSTSANTVLVPSAADLRVPAEMGASEWLFTLHQLEAVGVIIEDVEGGVQLSAGGFGEAKVEDKATKDSHLIGELGSFEEHHASGVRCLVGLEIGPAIEGF